jgi:hypothetical protein
VENPERKCKIKATQSFTSGKKEKRKEKEQGGSKTQIRHKTPRTSKCRHRGRRERARVYKVSP